MILFCSRVPYIIEVDGDSSQIATKIELTIWGFDETEPSTPTHVIEKEIFSPTQYVGEYNISPFVYDKLNNTNRALFVKVKSYYKISTDWISADAIELIGTKGYDESNPLFSGYYVLESFVDKRYYLTPDPFTNEFFTGLKIDIIFNFDTYSELRVRYFTDTADEIVDYTEYEGINYLSIPKSTYYSGDFAQGNSFELQYKFEGDWVTFYTGEVTPECEPKFNPYVLTYTNILGGQSQLYLFKKSTISNEYKSSEYNLAGSKQVFNKNGVQSFKLNTGWISEDVVRAIRQMMLSENLALNSSDSEISTYVVLKNSSFIEKTNLNDKVINYEFDFESATPLIQNYV
jgi:hypothetical protein